MTFLKQLATDIILTLYNFLALCAGATFSVMMFTLHSAKNPLVAGILLIFLTIIIFMPHVLHPLFCLITPIYC